MSGKVQISSPRGSTISGWDDNPLLHIVRICLLFTQQLFKEAPKGQLQWDPDDDYTNIIITDNTPLKVEVVQKMPAIVTVRSQVGWAGIGLDQLRELDLKTGTRIHTDMISGNMTFNCLSRSRNEAELIAWVLSDHLWALRYILLKLGFHDIGQRIQVLPASPAGSIIQGDTEGEIINVPAVVPFHFQHTISVAERELTLLDQIEANINVQMSDVIRPTEIAMEGGFGTARQQVDGDVVRFQNIKGRVNPPHVRGRPRTAITTRVGGNKADPPITINVKT